MKSAKMLVAVVMACLLTTGMLSAEESESKENILPAGEYQAGSGGVPEGWSVDKGWMSGNVKLMDEDGEKFLRIHKAPTSMGATADLPDGVGSVRLATRIRLQDYEQGAKGWDNCNLMVTFLDEYGEKLNNVWKQGLKFRKDQDWKDEEKTYTVPEGTKKIMVELNHKASAGTFDIGEICVTAE